MFLSFFFSLGTIPTLSRHAAACPPLPARLPGRGDGKNIRSVCFPLRAYGTIPLCRRLRGSYSGGISPEGRISDFHRLFYLFCLDSFSVLPDISTTEQFRGTRVALRRLASLAPCPRNNLWYTKISNTEILGIRKTTYERKELVENPIKRKK